MMDHFSPIAGAQIRALVLPVGSSIERTCFSRVVQRLQAEASLIALPDIAPHSHDNAHFLSPHSFPHGSLVYRFSPSAPSEQQQQLSPYELFREPLLVIGVVDHRGQQCENDARHKELDAAAAYLKERHPRVVHRQLMVLVADHADGESVSSISKAVAVSNVDTHNDPALRAAICAISARFLVELTTYAKALQASPTIQTPGQTARSLQRSGSLRDNEIRSGSGVSSPADEESPSRAPSKAPPLPATSFDQMPSANTVSNALERSDSRGSSHGGSSKPKGHNRTSSHDRIALQGFGSGTSADKARVRGKARVGIVVGSIYMMAGHWHDALPILVEHTTKARALSDHLWHAKGLEYALLCMLLLAWAGVDFQVPTICDPTTERTGSSTIARASIDARLAAEGMQRQIVRLSVAIPDLCRLILSLFRSHEGALELPPIVPAEASVRISRLLAALSVAGGELSPATLRPLVVGQMTSGQTQYDVNTKSIPLPLGRQRPYSKMVIAALLTQALPATDEGMAVADHIRLLSGIASSYAILGLDRKKAITVKELISRVTQALLHARKLGAAEMGIHPAAALSVESGPESLLPQDEDSSGIHDLIAELAAVYGAKIVPSKQQEWPVYVESKNFGSESLKLNLLKELAHFCEASPDPHGVITLTASLLRAAGPSSALDAGLIDVGNAFSREEQMHYATVIHRTVAVSKHLGLTDVEAMYWDPFLVRMVQILQPTGQRAVIDRSKLNVALKSSDQPIAPGNPLLYDPSASRPGTAARETFLLVANEASECMITLQNPFDIPVDIESLRLVTDGVELASQHQPTTLGPLRFQQVTLMVTPQAVGTTRITGCQIKMQGCHSQVFPIITTSWSPRTLLTVKDLYDGTRALNPASTPETALEHLGIEPDYVSATVIDELPTLILENTTALESGLMLLEGESRSLELILRNTGSIAATVFEATDTADVLRRDEEHKLKLRGVRHKRSKSFLPTTAVAPGECTTFKFRVEGKAGLSSTQANFYYQASSGLDTKHARVVSVPVIMTVNAALQVHNMEVIQPDETNGNDLLVYFDLRNAWPKSVFYECFEKAAPRQEWRRESSDAPQDIKHGQLAPGEVRRIYLTLHQDTSTFDYEEEPEIARTRFLDQMHISWRVEEHSGYVDLQSLPLPSDILDLVRGSPVSIDVQTSSTTPDVQVGSYVTVTTKLKSRSKHPQGSHLSVELCPRSHDSRRMAFAGNLRRILTPLKEYAETSVTFVFCPLLAGPMEFDIVVRPAQIGRAAAPETWSAHKAVAVNVRQKPHAG